MPMLNGGCHCGNLEVAFETPQAPEALELRACQCSFCRRHGALSISDPQGGVTFTAREPNQLVRYRFALGVTEFLICGRCGVYVGAVCEIDGRTLAVINANVVEPQKSFARPALAMEYGAEDREGRLKRRSSRWTPAVVRA